jgi:glycosyltransferase involved in cell wall biosynthesis
MSDQPKYSILIPSKNGLKYLKYAVESITSQCYENYELIISDNHSNDGTDQYLNEIKNAQVRSVKPDFPLAMHENYEFLIAHAKGEWLAIIGDDDALMPNFFKITDELLLKNKDIEIISSRRAYFFWPGSEADYRNININIQSSSYKKIRNTKLDLMLALGGYKNCFDLPQLYTSSVVKRALIEKIKSRQSGKFYYSIIPDMYSIIALTMNANNYLRIGVPLFLIGTSPKSMGISNRIYLDTENASKNLSINKDFPIEIHALGLSTAYLYECLMQYPCDIHKIWRSKLLNYFIFGSILCGIKKGKFNIPIDENYLLLKFYKMINRRGLKIFYIKLICLPIKIYQLNEIFYRVGKFSYILLMSLLNINNYYIYYIKNRNINNITEIKEIIKKNRFLIKL